MVNIRKLVLTILKKPKLHPAVSTLRRRVKRLRSPLPMHWGISQGSTFNLKGRQTKMGGGIKKIDLIKHQYSALLQSTGVTRKPVEDLQTAVAAR